MWPYSTATGPVGQSLSLSTPYFPARGLYSSSNARIVAAQMREIRASGVGTIVVSWWGEGSPEAERLFCPTCGTQLVFRALAAPALAQQLAKRLEASTSGATPPSVAAAC